ncbi:MAG: hypothetical protein V1897_10090, partial [Pseudomonadota bacterium]
RASMVTHLVEPGGKYMLEEAADELQSFKRHCPPAARLGVFVSESDLAVGHGQNAVIRNGYAMNVASQIFENLFRSLYDWLTENHPLLFPNCFGKGDIRKGLAGLGHEFGSEDLRQGRDRRQKITAWFSPDMNI